MNLFDIFGSKEPQLDENLRKWFKDKWVRFGPDGEIRGDCARGDDSEGKPKCLPQSKAQSLGKKGRASAAARKRREDPNPERSGKAINVATKKKSNEGVAEGLNTGPQIIYATGPRTQGINDVDLVFKDLRTGKIVAHVVGNNNSLQEFALPGGGGDGGNLPERPPTYEIRMNNSKAPTYVAFGDPNQDSEHKVYKLGPKQPGEQAYYGMGMTLVSKLDWWSFLEKMLGEIMAEDDAIESGLVDRKGDGDLVFVKPQGVAEGLKEMDKTQTSPGRDGDIDWTKKQIHLGPEHIIKAKDVAKHALKALDKTMKKRHADTAKKKDVVEAFGPLPREKQQIRLGRHTVDIERVGLDNNYISFAWHDSQGQEHYEEVPVGDLGSYDDLIDRIKQEISYQERQYTDQGVAEEQLDELSCWSGYHRVAGTKAGFPGSCAKNKTNESEHSETCPHCGGEMFSEELINEKKDACYYKVKSRYKVWPSAYASGALVKCRKKGADSWGNKSEGVTEGLNEFAPGGSEGNGPFDYGSAIVQIGQDFVDAYNDEGAGSDAATIIKVGKTFMSAGMTAGIKAFYAMDTQLRDHVAEQLADEGFNVRQDIYEPYSKARTAAGNGTQTILALLKEFVKTVKHPEDREIVAGIYKAFQQGMEPGFVALFQSAAFDIDADFYKFARSRGVDPDKVAAQAGLDTDSLLEVKQGVAEGSLNEFAVDGFGDSGDHRSKLLASVGRLFDAGNKVDWQVPGQMGHVTRVQDDGITMKKWKTPHSRMSFFLPMRDDSRDSKYTIKMVGPKHYAVVSAEQGVAEGYQFKGGFPFDVDHMSGSRGINLPSAPTKKFFTDKKQWKQAVDDINSSKYDDNSDYIGVTGRSTVEINGHEWARWSDAQQKGYIELNSMSEQGAAENQVNEKWSQKYKDSINCSNPKGFSQKAHCAGQKKNEDIAEGKEYYTVIGTDSVSLRRDFNMIKDRNGWYLKEGATPKQKLEAFRAFGSPKLKEFNLAAFSGGTQTKGDDNVISPVGSKTRAQYKK